MLELTIKPTETCVGVGPINARLWEGHDGQGSSVVVFVLASGSDNLRSRPGLALEMEQADAPQKPEVAQAIRKAAALGIGHWQASRGLTSGAHLFGAPPPAAG